MADSGFKVVRRIMNEEDIRHLPAPTYVGYFTTLHLVKNLDLPMAKPFRHLQWIAEAAVFLIRRNLRKLMSHPIWELIQVGELVLRSYARQFSEYAVGFSALPAPNDPRGNRL